MLANRPLRHLYQACLAVTLASTANAGTVTPNGVVLLNRGNGFEVIQQPTAAAPNDRVLVNNGMAQITYGDGTTAQLRPGQIYTVGSSNVRSQEVHLVERHSTEAHLDGHNTCSTEHAREHIPCHAQGHVQGQGNLPGHIHGNGVVEGGGHAPPHGTAHAPSGLSGTALIGAGAGIAGLAVLLSSISSQTTKPAAPSSP